MLATKAPVFVRNATDDPRTVRSIMQTWDVSSILGVPMIVREDVVGILYLDNETAPHAFTEQHQSVASTFAHLAGIAIQQAQRASELRTNLQTVARQNELLRHSTAIEEKLTKLVLEGGTLADIATAASDLTGKPCAIHDGGFNRLAVGARPAAASHGERARRGVPSPAGRRAGAGRLTPNRPVVVDAIPGDGLLHRFLVARVVLHGKAWGYLAVMEFGSRFTALASPHHDARRPRSRSSSSRASRDRADRQAPREPGPGPRQRPRGPRGDRTPCGAAELPHRQPAPRLPARRAGRRRATDHRRGRAGVRAGRARRGRAWLMAVPQNGVALVLELDEDCPRPAALAKAKETIEKLQRAPGRRSEPVLAAISSACRAPADYGCAYTEAQQVLGCLGSLRGGEDSALTLLAADDLGAARLMLTMVDGAEADRFTRNTLGPLLEPGNRTLAELLDTVRAFFDADRSVRNSAKHLGVHENTIRYRLGRVLELAGLDVATDSSAQLTIQVALMILKIQGRLPTPA